MTWTSQSLPHQDHEAAIPGEGGMGAGGQSQCLSPPASEQDGTKHPSQGGLIPFLPVLPSPLETIPGFRSTIYGVIQSKPNLKMLRITHLLSRILNQEIPPATLGTNSSMNWNMSTTLEWETGHIHPQEALAPALSS